MKNALIIVDVQNDFTEGGSLAVTGGTQVAENIATHLMTHENKYDLIITTQDWHIDPGNHWADEPNYTDTWPVHCAANTPGADYRPELAQGLALLVNPPVRIYKGEMEAAYSGFEGHTENGTPLNQVLVDHNITNTYIVGLATDHCVKATALHAIENGYNVTIIENMTAGITPETTHAALTHLTEQGAAIIP